MKSKNIVLTICILLIFCMLMISQSTYYKNIKTTSDSTSVSTNNLQQQNTKLKPEETPVGVLQVDPITRTTYLEELFDKAYFEYDGKKMTLKDVMAKEKYFYNNIDDNHHIDMAMYTDSIVWSTLDNSKGFVTRLKLVNYGPKMEVWLMPPIDSNEKIYMGDDYKNLFMSKYIPDPSTSKYCMALINGTNY